MMNEFFNLASDGSKLPVFPASQPAAGRGTARGFLPVFTEIHRIIVSSETNNRLPGGFTLLELLVVMVIIGLLAGYVGPRYFAQIGKSEVKTARAQIDAFDKALDQYRLETGHYPSTEQGLDALMTRPEGEPKWAGPYLKKSVPVDPWGNKYVYRSPGEHGEYDLLSYGKDGKLGGTDEAADITNW